MVGEKTIKRDRIESHPYLLFSGMWRPIPGYPHYYAGRDGHIYTTKLGLLKQLKAALRHDGYLLVALWKGRKQESRTVQRLICSAWFGVPLERLDARHCPDSDRTNNRPVNLKWGTRQQNMSDIFNDRKAHSKPWLNNHKLSAEDVSEIRMSGNISREEIAKKYGVSKGAINHILKGSTWAYLPGADPDINKSRLALQESLRDSWTASIGSIVEFTNKNGDLEYTRTISNPWILHNLAVISLQSALGPVPLQVCRFLEANETEGKQIQASRRGKKLNQEQVKEIAVLLKGGCRRSTIAKQFGISVGNVGEIARGVIWGSVTGFGRLEL